jgi:ubiquinone/menaquinone biosynthesis C-methylase UbiE
VILEGSASIEISATVETLWAMVTDVSRMGEWSPETFEAGWVGLPGPEVGARFRGCNRLRWVGTWCSMATIVDCDPPRRFGFVIGKDPSRPNTEWTYDFEVVDDHTTVVTERYRMIREPRLVLAYYRLIDRQRSLSSGVVQTLDRLKMSAERPEPSGRLPAAPPRPAARGRRPPPMLLRAAFSHLYARFSPLAEARGGRRHRRSLVAGLEGRVIEIGCGNGLNFAHYQAPVTGVLAVEPDRHLRRDAEAAARRADVAIDVVDGDAGRLPAGDASFDVAVVSLVLCSVPDISVALAEIFRVLRPGGRLRFYEHVASASDPLRRMQRLATPVWRQMAGGCCPDRDTVEAIVAAGFVLDHVDHFDYVPGPGVPLRLVAPHVLGSASRP